MKTVINGAAGGLRGILLGIFFLPFHISLAFLSKV